MTASSVCMNAFAHDVLTLAVFPVLVGPLQTLLAVLPAILLGLGSMLFAAFKPAGFLRLVRFGWRQKYFFATVAAIVWAWQSGVPSRFLMGRGTRPTTMDTGAASNWDADRGGTRRTGRGPGDDDATAGDVVWANARDKTILSSPAISGDRVIFSTATDIGPFSPEGRGAIVCVDAHSGHEIWRYAPDNYRATFSSPVVSDHFVVCGEGLHQVEDARVTCLDLRTGQRLREFRTKSHVESTAAIADGRVFFGAGGDGFYCLALDPTTGDQPRVVWHLDGSGFPDCESSPVVADGVVYFGLGEGGSSVCAVDAATGRLLWRVDTPYPVFAPPTIADGKLFIATGNGNFVQSAADLLAMKLQALRDDGASEEELAAAREKHKPVGQVWCVDLATHQVNWKFATGDAILGAVACNAIGRGDDSLYFGSRDGHLYRVARDGTLLHKSNLREPIVCSPALGQKHVYCSTASGRLFCLDAVTLKPLWDATLGGGETFTSSPTIAHGHVYIGSAEQGLRCIGRPGEPAPPIWSKGKQGGRADDEPIPETLAVLWQYPSKSEQAFPVTVPLIPLGDAIYAAGKRGDQTVIVKLNTRTTDESRRVAWSRTISGTLNIAPAGVGQRILIAETPHEGSAPMLHCLDVGDGDILWSRPLAHHTQGLTVDVQHVFAWTKSQEIRCLNVETGATVWNERFEADVPPDVADGILVCAGRRSLTAVDVFTGVVLWQQNSIGTAADRLAIDDREIRVTAGDRVIVHSLIDGQHLRTEPAIEERLMRGEIPDEAGRAVTSLVSLKARVYFGNDSGRIVCLGAEQP
jgi:outer membrane protein assembly factor BamB